MTANNFRKHYTYSISCDEYIQLSYCHIYCYDMTMAHTAETRKKFFSSIISLLLILLPFAVLFLLISLTYRVVDDRSPAYLVSGTVLIGLMLFIAQQIIQRLLINPVLEMRELLGILSDKLVFYAEHWANPCTIQPPSAETPGEYARARKEIRLLSSSLRSKSSQIIAHRYFELIKIIPNRNSINEAANIIMGISNSLTTERPVDGSKNTKDIQRIEELLHIKIIDN